MTRSVQLNDDDLRQLEKALESGGLREEERLEHWVAGLLAEVKHHRGGHHTHGPEGSGASDAVDAEPRKSHGDALLDHSGSRHGETPG